MLSLGSGAWLKPWAPGRAVPPPRDKESSAQMRGTDKVIARKNDFGREPRVDEVEESDPEMDI